MLAIDVRPTEIATRCGKYMCDFKNFAEFSMGFGCWRRGEEFEDDLDADGPRRRQLLGMSKGRLT
jgi:hypothetical protein